MHCLLSARNSASLKKLQREYNLHIFQPPNYKSSQSMLNLFFPSLKLAKFNNIVTDMWLTKPIATTITNWFKTMGSSPNSNAKSSTGKKKTGLKQDMSEKMPTCCIQTTGSPCVHNLLPNEGLHPASSASTAPFTTASVHFCTLDSSHKLPMSLSCLLPPSLPAAPQWK